LAITEIPTRGQVMKWIEETLDFASDDIVKFRYAAHTEFFLLSGAESDCCNETIF